MLYRLKIVVNLTTRSVLTLSPRIVRIRVVELFRFIGLKLDPMNFDLDRHHPVNERETDLNERENEMAETKFQEVNTVADYLCWKAMTGGEEVTVLKMHKLVYYAQAWHLVFTKGVPLMDTQFEAWVHGPVNKRLFSRFVPAKTMYSNVSKDDIEITRVRSVPTPVAQFLDSILESYGHLTGTQLEQLTHKERPWMEARKGLQPDEPSTAVISNQVMQEYYSSLLKSPQVG
jgi:uncharacterized phage-associated protein